MPNGCDRLLAAARALSATDLLATDGAIPDDAAEVFLAANRNAMDAAREALHNDCSVLIAYDKDFFERYSPACWDLLKLGQSFCLAAERAERRHDLARAVCDGVAALDVANSLRRGGLIVGMLVAGIVERLAIGRLRRIHRRLNSAEARHLAGELLRVDADRESFDQIADRDARWERAVDMPPERADFLTMDWPEEMREGLDEDDEHFLRGAMQSIAELPEFERREVERRLDDRERALLRLLAIESALAAHYRDRDAHAATLGHLVPDQLPALPLDPFTGEPFRYVASADECLLYSPGPTGIDHGGRFGCWADIEAGSADLCLAMSDFPCGIEP